MNLLDEGKQQYRQFQTQRVISNNNLSSSLKRFLFLYRLFSFPHQNGTMVRLGKTENIKILTMIQYGDKSVLPKYCIL